MLHARYEYGPFGEPIRVTGPAALLNPFRWSTKFTDEESGLVYYGYRYYSPTLGRWLSRDPVDQGGGVNLYGFIANDPADGFDPWGLLEEEDQEQWDLDIRLAIAAEASAFVGTYAYDAEMLLEYMEHMERAGEELAQMGKDLAMAVGMTVGGGIAGQLVGRGFGAAARATSAPAARVAAGTVADLPAALQGGRATVQVYYGIRNGQRVYVGITNNLFRRQREWAGVYDKLELVTETYFTRGQARAIEQALIARNPGFENFRNSIWPGHPCV